MKKIIVFSFIIALCLNLTACSNSKTTIMGKKEISDEGLYSLSYIRFTGTRRTEIYLEKPQMVEFAVMTNFGKLDIEIFGDDEDKKEHSLFYGEDIPTGKSSVYLEEGYYKVYLYGGGHSGGVTIRHEIPSIEAENPPMDDLS